MAMSVAQERKEFFDKNKGRGWTPLLWFKWNLAKTVVFDRIAENLGGNLQWAATGGSKCPEKIQDFFDLIGIPLIEGYGSTETSPVLTMERYGPTELTQGGQRPLPGITLKICDQDGKNVPEGIVGEICASGPNIMLGYWKNSDETSKAFYEFNDGQKFFRTGDSGIIRSDPGTAGIVLEIKGRLKSAFKLANGKFVDPEKIEATLNESGLVSQACVFGLNRPSTIVAFYPNPDSNKKTTDLVKEILLYLDDRIDKKYTIPKGFIVLSEELTVENGLLTPKLSIKKHILEQQLEKTISEIYSDLEANIASPIKEHEIVAAEP